MIFVTGRCLEGKKIVGYRLYDYESKQWAIVSSEKLKRAFIKDKQLKIVGLEYIPSETGLGSLRQKMGYYKTKFTDEVNGKGETIDKENNKYVLLTVRGVAEETKYICLKYENIEVEFSKAEFEELVKQYRVIGAYLARMVCIADFYKYIRE